MRFARCVFAAAASVLALGSPASAEVSDQDYIQASRCAAIARSSKFKSPDAQAYKAFLETEARGRTITTRRRADMAASLAKQEALTASGEKKADLEAELSGVCQAFKLQAAGD